MRRSKAASRPPCVEQISHGASSRRPLTVSSVTIASRFVIGSSAIPLRVRRLAAGRRERLASSESTWPVLLFLLGCNRFCRRQHVVVDGQGRSHGLPHQSSRITYAAAGALSIRLRLAR